MVHFIKKHLWFLEAAYALLEGDELTEMERSQLAVPEMSQGLPLEEHHEAVAERVYEDELSITPRNHRPQ